MELEKNIAGIILLIGVTQTHPMGSFVTIGILILILLLKQKN